jgi:hypothetical protein
MDIPAEIAGLEIKSWPQCEMAADGRFWAHEGDGKWQPYTGRIFTLSDTPGDPDIMNSPPNVVDGWLTK